MVTKCDGKSLNLEELSISGISCRLPESNNIDEFAKNLFEGIETTAEDERRWTPGIFGLPSRSGKIANLDHFDATFFRIHAKQADRMDPALRLLIELSFEAIVDSGTNPTEIRGSRTGVFIGSTPGDSEEAWTIDPDTITGYERTGCYSSMFANRISYAFDFRGPSYLIESKCTSSMVALEQAVSSIRVGRCDAALVGGVNILLKPQNATKLQKMGFLSPDGRTRAFDCEANGYASSEGAVVLFIQKPTKSRRSYASILHIKSNMDGFKKDGIEFPSGGMKKQLYEEIYTQAGVNPLDVSYVETNGTGIQYEDEEELNSMSKIFCEGRDPSHPLLIGAVKSNMGHTAAASGLCSLAKVLIAIGKSNIPKNLSFVNPNLKIPGLIDGTFKVITENNPWEGSLVGINCFNSFGSNSHAILRGTKIVTSGTISASSIPLLVHFSGSTKTGVEYGLRRICEISENSNAVALLHQIFQSNINGHLFRGFGMYAEKTSETHMIEVQQIPNKLPPIWFIFSGMGSQWKGMAKDHMKFHIFKESINKSASYLDKVGINLLQLLGTENSVLPDSIATQTSGVTEALDTFVCITAIQIALIDLLHNLGIHPDGLIGHSVGETACSYADGCLTAEQTIMASYARGKAILELKTAPGAMAAVGMTWEEAGRRCPLDIFPACHNAQDSVTVSGPLDSINNFVDQLQSQGIFAKLVNSTGRAFHSKYIADSGNVMRTYLEQIIPDPKPRSTKWISSSISQCNWDSPLAQTCSAAYHVNNSVNPVLFHDALAHVPKNALVIEIAPHALLQSIIKRSLGPNVTILGLMNRSVPRNDIHFLSSIGRIYAAGYNPDLATLYDKVEFPVPVGTPMISHLVQWDHTTSWDVPHFSKFLHGASRFSNIVEISLESQEICGEHSTLGYDCDTEDSDSKMAEQIIFPNMGYIFLIWETLAQLNGTTFQNLPVIFENVTLHRRITLEKSCPIKFKINILKGNGSFEINYESSTLCSGWIKMTENIQSEFIQSSCLQFDKYDIEIPEFQEHNFNRINSPRINIKGSTGKLLWNNAWVSLLETLVEININEQGSRDVTNLIHMEKAVMDPSLLVTPLDSTGNGHPASVSVKKYKNTNILHCAGIELRGLRFENVRKNIVEIVQSCPTDVDELITTPSKCESQQSGYDRLVWDLSFNGFDQFAGEDLSGRRIMGLLPSNSGEIPGKDTEYIWNIPNSWRLEDAAKLPVSYTLAYYALIVRGELQPSESILIHSGSSTLGQAGISLALSMNCDVFATVTTEKELLFLMSRFPKLQEDNLCLETRFEQNVLERTKGQGVNVILTTCGGQVEPALRCISRHGRFIHVGTEQMNNNDSIGMSVFLSNVAYHGINPNVAFNHKDFKSTVDLVRNGILSGTVKSY